MSFNLPDTFIGKYKDREVDWGFKDAGGNSLGELTFLRTYSRVKEDGTKEQWWEVCRRVIEGMYSIQKDYVKSNRLPWNDRKAQASAQEAYERMFTFKWTPPGRGLFQMGVPFVMDKNNSASLQNCAMISTGDMDRNDPGYVFYWVMDALMLGIGVGWDTKAKDKNFEVFMPKQDDLEVWEIPDSREGWAESTQRLINSYLKSNQNKIQFDYSKIRAKGEPIKGFGGTASGPQPLIDMHNKMSEILSKETGNYVGSRLIADLMNLIGTCVVAGNVRRSAEIGLGQPDDDDFINLKNPDYFPERNSYDPEDPGWSWMSNNSLDVKSGQDYSKFIERIASNGEPGFIWMDTTRKYGRLLDPINNKDRRAAGYNPCLSGDSLLLNENGWVRFDEAAINGQRQNIVVDGRVSYLPSADGLEHPENWKIDLRSGYNPMIMQASEVFLTKKNTDIVKIETSNGMSVRLTPDHLVATKRGMVRADELVIGKDKVLVTRGAYPIDELGLPETIDEMSASLIGLITGDGCILKGKLTDKVSIDLWGDDRHLGENICNWIQSIYDKYSDVYVSNSNRPFSPFNVSVEDDRQQIRISSSFLAAYLNDKYSFNRETKHIVPKEFIVNARSRSARFYVAALAFCDGTINKYNKVGSSSARISQANQQLLKDVQLICLANGISSSVYKRRNAGARLMPDGRGGNKEYFCQANYEIVFMAQAFEFAKYIGFLSGEKQNRAKILTPSRKKNTWTVVLNVSEDGIEDVYCLREPEKRILCANGFTMRRCAEQSLESFELCTLVEVHMNRAESKEDYLRTLKFAYLYGKTVTLLPTHWDRSNAVMQRNRRIGASTTGVASFYEEHGLPVLREWWNEGYEEIQRRDHEYSEWLGVRESVKTTSIKPSGTVSLLSGATPGVHWPPGGKHYLRAIRFASDDPMVPKFMLAGYTVEQDVVSRNTVVVYFPIATNVRGEKEVSIFEKINLASEAQRHWADNAVSATISFDKKLESEYIPTVLNMYEGKLKTISFLPMGNDVYQQQPYTSITEQEYNAYVDKLSKIDMDDAYANGVDAVGEKYCANDTCEIKVEG